jgi:predicted RNA-binding Zn ribbon-like protein
MVRTTPENIHLWGGAVCLDFANTVDWTPDLDFVDPDRTDVLVSGPWVARWARRVGIGGRGRISEREVARLRELRLVVYRLFASPAPPAGDVEALRQTAAEGLAAARLRPAGGTVRPAWAGGDERRVRFTVAWDALRLLIDEERRGRVARCPGRNCGWLFLNTSGRRRWCAMSACGSREKMRRAYARKRTAAAARSHGC